VAWPESGAPNGTASATGDADVAAIEAELERARDRVAASVRALGDEVARRSDWREWLRAHPVLILAGAAALGFLAGRGHCPAVSNPKRRT
jgi:hypothetical protein